jgi:PQQ enzyme-like repeat protein
MYALDAATGAVKWAFASGGSVAGGSAVVDGPVYWGSGYKIGPVNGANMGHAATQRCSGSRSVPTRERHGQNDVMPGVRRYDLS